MIITVYKGRTVYLAISPKVKSTGQPYILQTGDKIRFGVRPEFGGKYAIIKTLTSANEVNNVYPLTLTVNDTNISPRRYLYDVSIEFADGTKQDIQPTDYFIIRDSIT